jgi:hypothetical protein
MLMSQSGANAFAAMKTIVLGNRTSATFVAMNACASTRLKRETHSKETDERNLQLPKDDKPIISTVLGRVIEWIEDARKALDGIRCNSQSGSKQTDVRNSQFAKQDSPSSETVRGTVIEANDDAQNAYDSIRFKSQSDSNETDTSDSQELKLSEEMVPTFRETKIDATLDAENAFFPVDVTLSDSAVGSSKTRDRREISLCPSCSPVATKAAPWRKKPIPSNMTDQMV